MRGKTGEEHRPGEPACIGPEHAEPIPRLRDVGLGRPGIESPGRVPERALGKHADPARLRLGDRAVERSEEHTSELQSRLHLVCRLLLEKKKTTASSSSS